LPPLLLLAAFWARKGWVAALLPFALACIIALPQPAYAAGNEKIPGKSATGYLDIEHLWSSPDQKAMKAFNAGDNESAAREFTRPDWKASAFYRSGNYQAAASVLEDPADSNGFYNKANALARLGKYQEAIKAYDRAIELDKNNDDARFNREQVKKAMQQQKQQQDNSGQQNPEQQKDQQDSKDQSQQNQQSQNQQQNRQQDKQSQQDQNSNDQNSNDQQQQQDSQSSEQSSAENNKQADENKPADSSADNQQQSETQKQAEEKQLKQRDAAAEQKKEQQEKQQYEQQQQEQQQHKDNGQDSGQHSNEIENRDSKEKPAEIEVNPTEASITEDEKATEQWLKRIPDDPGGLLRRKFLYQYKQMPDQSDDEQPW